MHFTEHKLKGLIEITCMPHTDERGSFLRLFDEKIFKDSGLPSLWVQENLSVNVKKGIIRGLHFILPPHTDGKLIRCSNGEIFDVVVDLRKASPTLGQWMGFVLKENDNRWLYIPKGFAHGFCTLTDHSAVIYKHDTFYNKAGDTGIVYNDKDLDISWPCKNPVLSEKDKNLITFKDFILKYGGL